VTQHSKTSKIILVRIVTMILLFFLVGNSLANESASSDTNYSHTFINSWQGTSTCLECHLKEAKDIHASLHYQWLGDTPYMTVGEALQGKLGIAVNSYCINILGNWKSCGKCHIGLGKKPEKQPSLTQLENIDCLLCHQKKYKRKLQNGSFVPATEEMEISILEAAQTVHLPDRENCLQCHARGGGGDNYKRGDLTLAHANTGDRNFDVHMSTTGANLQCRSCHHSANHRIAGRGSDLRATDLDEEISCVSCHQSKATTGHSENEINSHVARVACQTCHIPLFARNASDTASSEATEIYRNWLTPHETGNGLFHPQYILANDVVPQYRWWNRFSTNYTLYSSMPRNRTTGRVPTSKPEGEINDENAKLFPFKYKVALQPLATENNTLIALDTNIYFHTGDPHEAVKNGLFNMGYSMDMTYEWVETETYQLITHEVAPASAALSCKDCHENSNRMNLIRELGYELQGPTNQVCTKCHKYKDPPGYKEIHEKHVNSKHYDCSWCHNFSRPERRLKMPEGTPDLAFASGRWKKRPNGQFDIVVTIHNVGVITAKNIPVKFFLGSADGTTLGEVILPMVGPRNKAIVSFPIAQNSLTIDPGMATIYVQIDPENLIPETSDSNNLGMVQIPIQDSECKADINHDGSVNGADLEIFSYNYGKDACNMNLGCNGDTDSDGDIDGSDLAAMAEGFETCKSGY